jgi:hypothetical protein
MNELPPTEPRLRTEAKVFSAMPVFKDAFSKRAA